MKIEVQSDRSCRFQFSSSFVVRVGFDDAWGSVNITATNVIFHLDLILDLKNLKIDRGHTEMFSVE